MTATGGEAMDVGTSFQPEDEASVSFATPKPPVPRKAGRPPQQGLSAQPAKPAKPQQQHQDENRHAAFMKSLMGEKSINRGKKERELTGVKEKIRKMKSNERKQRQRMRDMDASLRGTSGEIISLSKRADQIQSELDQQADDTFDL
jgi:hypothetical protein